MYLRDQVPGIAYCVSSLERRRKLLPWGKPEPIALHVFRRDEQLLSEDDELLATLNSSRSIMLNGMSRIQATRGMVCLGTGRTQVRAGEHPIDVFWNTTFHSPLSGEAKNSRWALYDSYIDEKNDVFTPRSITQAMPKILLAMEQPDIDNLKHWSLR